VVSGTGLSWRGAKRFGIDLVRFAGGSLLAASGGRFPPGVPRKGGSRRILLLYYHRVHSVDEQPIYQLGIQRDIFRRQLTDLKDLFRFVPLIEALEAGVSGSPGEDLASLTFDDGYRDNYTCAFPVLRELGLPATIFLVAGLVGTTTRLWYDQVKVLVERLDGPSLPLPECLGGGSLEFRADLRGRRRTLSVLIGKLKECDDDVRRRALHELSTRHASLLAQDDGRDHLLTWEEARLMEEQGVSFGSHTMGHPLLTQISDDGILREEIAESRELLAGRLRSPLPVLAYPGGVFSGRVARMTQDCGYSWALATFPGWVAPGIDRMGVPRRGIGSRSSLFLGRRHSRTILRGECEGLFDQTRRGRRSASSRRGTEDLAVTILDTKAEASPPE